MTRSLFTLLTVVLVAGCASSPAPILLGLSAPTLGMSQVGAGGTAISRPGTPTIPVRVGPVSVPESIDRPQLVWQAAAHRLSLAEARWAQPLKAELAQALAAHLAVATDNPQVLPQEATLPSIPYRRVLVDVLRLELHDGGEAVLELAWSLRAETGKELAGQRLVLRRAQDGTGAEAAARAISALVGELAMAIAPALR